MRERDVRVQDRLPGFVVVALGTAVALYARTFPPMPGQRIGPALFPTIVGLLLSVLGGALVASPGRLPGGPTPGRDTTLPRAAAAARFGAVAGVLLLYVVAVDWLGFLITGICFLSVLMLVFGVRRSRILPIAAAVTAAIHYGFYSVLGVPLPWGLLESIAW